MDPKFAVGDKVDVLDLETDTGIVFAVSAPAAPLFVKSLVTPGIVLTCREHPPGVDNPGEASPSPHCLVQLKTADGVEVDVWFTEARLVKAAA